MEKLVQATRNLNFSDVLFPHCDYVSFSKMHAELSPDIRKITERVRMVKNAFDENTFQEVGNIDLQAAIQAIASESNRNDVFTRDEELLKEETWTILIDSSKSLSGSSTELRAISICLAETAHSILSSSPWGMFAFSDELTCVKDYSERYDNLIKARIGGLRTNGLSYIPDALRACANLVRPHSRDRNFMILVSDGLPSGYERIEQEFGASVKELRARGIALIAMGLGSNNIKKTIRNARIVHRPTDIAKEFMEVYMSLSS
jgi:nitric oxide reductase activation protein